MFFTFSVLFETIFKVSFQKRRNENTENIFLKIFFFLLLKRESVKEAT